MRPHVIPSQQVAIHSYFSSLSSTAVSCNQNLIGIKANKLRAGGSLRLLGWEKLNVFHPLPLKKHMNQSYRMRDTTVLNMDIPDFLPSAWTKDRQERKPVGPSVELTAEEAVERQLLVLRNNDTPRPDHGVEVMYSFAGFDPFQRSRYFGHVYDLGQFERFRRIFHHSSYRALLNHQEHVVLSSFYPSERCFKQRVWVRGARPGEEETFEFTLTQRLGGHWDGYWLTESLVPDSPAKEDD
eukprot:TRINITY_DN20224_c0_g1_i1.p1 TRINITY_DN20224_c0_g1~~TRINITY_DN20224_c0_g1_i1.p1  ORF type:complete len:240 (+),score=41.98 TRINITY_DN20224_c0_g1_i1:99-818(+)